jgi:hypothetical protein
MKGDETKPKLEITLKGFGSKDFAQNIETQRLNASNSVALQHLYSSHSGTPLYRRYLPE